MIGRIIDDKGRTVIRRQGENVRVSEGRVFTVSFDVRFPEVDSYGVVWHGHYLLYMEVARDGLCAAFGLTPARALAAGYKVPITRAEISLKQPARLDDRLEVSVRLRPPEIAKLVLDYEVSRLPRREMLARGTTEQVILAPDNQLLLGFPQAIRTLVGRILAWQNGEGEPPDRSPIPFG
jgi:acyl-CoA thioester hydrolase